MREPPLDVQHRRRPSEETLRVTGVVAMLLLDGVLVWILAGLVQTHAWGYVAVIGVLLGLQILYVWAMLTREISDEDVELYGRTSFFGGPFNFRVLLGSQPRRRASSRTHGAVQQRAEADEAREG